MSEGLYTPVIAVCGAFQRGKSLLINALLRRRVAVTGDGNSTTKCAARYEFSREERIQLHDRTGAMRAVVEIGRGTEVSQLLQSVARQNDVEGAWFRVFVSEEALSRVTLLDTPGVDFDLRDDGVAKAALGEVDFALVVVENKELSIEEKGLLSRLAMRHVPHSVVFNCRNNDERWQPDSLMNEEGVSNWMAAVEPTMHYAAPGNGLVNVYWWAVGERTAGRDTLELEAHRRTVARYFDAVELPVPDNVALIQAARGENLRRFLLPPSEELLGWNAPAAARLHRECGEWMNQLQFQSRRLIG